MSSKRSFAATKANGHASHPDANQRKRPHARGKGIETKSLEKISVIDLHKTSPKTFFQDFVSQRRPCILSCSDPQDDDGRIPGCRQLRRSELVPALRRLAGTKTVQVEKRTSTEEAFGQNRTTTRQVEMTLNAFLDTMTTTNSNQDNAEMLYLSPQQHQQKVSPSTSPPAAAAPATTNNQDNADSKAVGPDDPFSTPCQELVQEELIPRHLDWAGNLILHQCNLWFGHSKEGSSSGLHNDFHDNFYLLVQGRKRFRLYAPQNAPNMYTHGTIQHIYPNGLCSYVGHELRSDGVPLAVLAAFEEKDAREKDDKKNHKSTELNGDDDDDDNDDDDDDDDEEDEGGAVIIGKGFDYRSSDDDKSDEGLFDQDVDDYDELVADKDEQDDDDDDEDKAMHSSSDEKRPDHFSRIDPKLLHPDQKDALSREFPRIVDCQQYVVELEAGQVLYLPASWFHEVTSMNGGQTSNDVPSSNHIALNYWYYPPDALDNFDNPYQDDFWKRMTGKTP